MTNKELGTIGTVEKIDLVRKELLSLKKIARDGLVTQAALLEAMALLDDIERDVKALARDAESSYTS